MKKLGLLSLVVLLGACSATTVGDQDSVTISNASSPADGLPAATQWCAKYGKVPRHTGSGTDGTVTTQAYSCVPKGT